MIIEAPATRAQLLAATIERHVAENSLGSGDAVGTIEGWRARSGYARATVGEAIRVLVDRGAIEVRPGRGGGIFVAGTGPVVRLRHTLLSVHGETATLADAITIREALEPLIVADATRTRTAAQLRSLRRSLATVSSAMDDHDSFIRAIWGLHQEIALITPNEMLRAMYLAMMQVIDEHADSARSDRDEGSVEYRLHRYEIHAELVQAIESGDGARVASVVHHHRGDTP
ncbi:FadR/GntR family transcriptional regulator [Glaciibacter superstes]|uniref:FadR/GntR family transcriptional regulator n=1 Tax=Glaciibacter superstes TaxID=501023 RepID=UPI0003B6892F|nr:FCD domain-containing protein [Glaciibacter superstes]